MDKIKSVIFFIALITVHLELLFIFVSKLYALYFILLLITGYLFLKKYNYFSYKIFFLGLFVLVTLSSKAYFGDIIFDLSLYLNILNSLPYVNDEVMYILSVIHILILMNLKKIENFWDIIDKNY